MGTENRKHGHLYLHTIDPFFQFSIPNSYKITSFRAVLLQYLK